MNLWYFPGSKKCLKQSRKSLWSVKKDCFETPETLPRLFQTLLDPGAFRPREALSETLRGFRARRARETPLRGGRYPNPRVLRRALFGTFRALDTHSWSKNRTGENRTGEPRPSTRGPLRGHLRGRFRGESLKAENREISPRGCSRGQTRGATRGPTRGATRGPTRGSRFAFACSVRLQTPVDGGRDRKTCATKILRNFRVNFQSAICFKRETDFFIQCWY